MTKTFLHVAVNSYFATILQQENPQLRGRPVGVIKETGRTVLIATSKEAKRFGVGTGSYVADGKSRCPTLAVLPAEFDRYLAATKQLYQIFNQVAPTVQIYSLDEAFIDISDCRRHLYPEPEQLALNIKRLIKQTLGSWVTCNIGIGPNRFMAKLASEMSQPDSILTADTNNTDILLAQAAFKNVCGIGHRLERKLKILGITNPYQIRFYSDETLTRLVGPYWAVELKKIAYGQEPHLLELVSQPPPHQYTVGRSITGWRTTSQAQEILQVLLNLTEEVTFKTRAMNLAGRQIHLSLSGQDQHWHTHSTLKFPIRHTQTMFAIIKNQLFPTWSPHFAVIKFAVALSLLKPLKQTQPPLWLDWHQTERLAEATDSVNQRFGLFTIKPASLLNHKIIRPEVTGFLGDKHFHQLIKLAPASDQDHF